MLTQEHGSNVEPIRQTTPDDWFIWADDFANKNVAGAVFRLGGNTYGALAALTDEQLESEGLNSGEIGLARQLSALHNRRLEVSARIGETAAASLPNAPDQAPMSGQLAAGAEAQIIAFPAGQIPAAPDSQGAVSALLMHHL